MKGAALGVGAAPAADYEFLQEAAFDIAPGVVADRVHAYDRPIDLCTTA
jgi:hypothetical protein